jgi:hypothetical protein
MTMKEENNGTAIVTPDKHSAYMRPMFPKKMHTPEAMAKPIRGAFSCRTCNSIQRRIVEAPSGLLEHCSAGSSAHKDAALM